MRPIIPITSFGDEWRGMVYTLRNINDVYRFERELGAMTVQYNVSKETVVNYVKKEYGDDLKRIEKYLRLYRETAKELYATRANSKKRPELLERHASYFRRAREELRDLTIYFIDNEVRFTEHDWPWRTITD